MRYTIDFPAVGLIICHFNPQAVQSRDIRYIEYGFRRTFHLRQAHCLRARCTIFSPILHHVRGHEESCIEQ